MNTAVDIAARIGVTDAFAPHRVSDHQLVDLAGVDRLVGWAGKSFAPAATAVA